MPQLDEPDTRRDELIAHAASLLEPSLGKDAELLKHLGSYTTQTQKQIRQTILEFARGERPSLTEGQRARYTRILQCAQEMMDLLGIIDYKGEDEM
jgi:hypothetical protein